MIINQLQKEERELDITSKIVFAGIIFSVLVALVGIIGFLLMAYQI